MGMTNNGITFRELVEMYISNNIAIVRPGHVYGPMMTKTDSKASAQFSRLASQGKPIIMKSKGEQLRS